MKKKGVLTDIPLPSVRRPPSTRLDSCRRCADTGEPSSASRAQGLSAVCRGKVAMESLKKPVIGGHNTVGSEEKLGMEREMSVA